MSNTIKLLFLTYVLLAIAIVVFVIIIISKHDKKRYSNILDTLEREKNLIINSNILTELNKVESLINSKEVEVKYREWKRRFDEIKNVDVPQLTDHLIEIEDLFKAKKYKKIEPTLAKVELNIYHVKTKAGYLIEEIREITQSEEKNRETITKLKIKYRSVLNTYHDKERIYSVIKTPIELQFETIDKLFSAFEVAMDKNAYSDVSKIVKALDDSINNLEIVIDEAPDIINLGLKVIPKKMIDIGNIYGKMVRNGYNLDYLMVENNITEAEKKIADIFDRLKVLNLEDSMLELKTISTYFDGIYNDFDKEKLAKASFNELGRTIANNASKLAKIVYSLTKKMDALRKQYIITDDDIKGLNIAGISIQGIEEDYDMVVRNAKDKNSPFSKLIKEMQEIEERLSVIEGNVNNILTLLNNYKESEIRAGEQLEEVKQLLLNSKEKITSYKLPMVPKRYYVELSEATESINEMIRELEKRPLNIEVLNTRVDTSRDLTLKLYKTTNEIVKTASMSEHAIIYGNRYRTQNASVNSGLKKAEYYFYRGNFKSSLEEALKALNIVEPGIHKKLLEDCNNDINS